MKITVVTGSRADFGLLEWPIKMLRAEPDFKVEVVKVWNFSFSDAYEQIVSGTRPDLLLVLGDRYEILGCVVAAHLQRIPIAHIAGGDVTEGSYDGAMRDAISRMASVHFVTSTSAMARLTHMGCTNMHLVGNPGLDYIRFANWKKKRPFPMPYIVISYQPETLDGTNEINEIFAMLPKDKFLVFLLPNPDRGSEEIQRAIESFIECKPTMIAYHWLPHDEYLNLLLHCDEFIGNSSSMLYEAPELGVKVRMIGKRQRGRVIPWGDGYAAERIVKILKYTHL